MRNPGAILGGLIPQARFVTVVILLINFGLYAAQSLAPSAGIVQAGASVPWTMMQGQWWRLLTAGFLHGGLIHILMNSWVLFDLGAEVEQIYGTSRLIVFYVISTITGFWVSSRFGGAVSVGSSAGIFGLIGAMMAFGVFDQSTMARAVKSMYSRWLIYLVVLSFFPGVDFRAHLGGFVGGFAAGWLASTPRARMMWKEPLLRGIAAVCILMTLAAFALMFLYMRAATPA